MPKLIDHIFNNEIEAALAIIPTLSESQREQKFSIDAFFSCTALHFAALLGQDTVVQSLLACGANAQARDKFNQTPMHYAATACEEADRQKKLNIMGMLHSTEPYLIYDFDNKGDTPLHVAAMFGEYDWVKYLLELGSSAVTPNNKGLKPVQLVPTEEDKLVHLLGIRESSLQVHTLRKIKEVVKKSPDDAASQALWAQFLQTAPEHMVAQYVMLDEKSPRLAVWCFNQARQAEREKAQAEKAQTTLVNEVTENLAGLSLTS